MQLSRPELSCRKPGSHSSLTTVSVEQRSTHLRQLDIGFRRLALKAIYEAKEVLHGFYRTKSRKQAKLRLTGLCDALALSPILELSTIRSTLVRWRKEILAYWLCRLTNARTEGFNNKAKLVKRRAFGYVSFRHYRLRLLNACSG